MAYIIAVNVSLQEKLTLMQATRQTADNITSSPKFYPSLEVPANALQTRSTTARMTQHICNAKQVSHIFKA